LSKGTKAVKCDVIIGRSKEGKKILNKTKNAFFFLCSFIFVFLRLSRRHLVSIKLRENESRLQLNQIRFRRRRKKNWKRWRFRKELKHANNTFLACFFVKLNIFIKNIILFLDISIKQIHFIYLYKTNISFLILFW